MMIEALAERAEAATMAAMESWAAPDAVERLGIADARIGGGLALAVREDPTEYWSRVLCLGRDEPITDAIIGQAIEFYRDNGNKIAVFPIAPSARPADWARICERHGLTAGAFIHKLVREPDIELPPTASTLPVRPIAVEDRAHWAETMLGAFDMPDSLVPMVSNALTQPGVTAFGAYAGTEMAASGLMTVSEAPDGTRVAHIGSGFTLPPYRRGGIQSAMIAARVQAARDAGCALVVVEAKDELPGEHNISLRNLLRQGFRVLYKRQNWTWRA